MRCIIAGGRDFNDYERLCKVMNNCPYEVTEVVCGLAKGADYLGHCWALENNIPIKCFEADWNNLGKRAGHVRNTQMGDYANEHGDGLLVAFWNQSSRGTKHMIDYATKIGMTVKVFYY